MRNILVLICVMLAVAAGVFFGCKSEQTTAAPGEAIITGTVRDSSGTPLAGVTVQASSVSSGSPSTTTAADGTYQLNFTVDSTALVTLTLTKSGYIQISTQVSIQSGVSTPMDFVLAPKSVIVPPVGGGSGIAQTIAFLGATPAEVRVYGVGGQETSILGWEVRDSLGFPIDAVHAVTLTFTMYGNPQGGEYISPASQLTNSAGRAYTTFNAGVKAGVVQVLAQATNSSGKVITSSPVRVIIDAGFPDQDHFTIAPAVYNFAAFDWVGHTDAVSVQIGDKYSNPVAPNTAVYFHTSPFPAAGGRGGGAGVVTPSVYTNGIGQGTAILYSGNPQPSGGYAAQGPGVPDTMGYHFVVATTVGEAGASVSDSVLLLWSATALIRNVNPVSFDIPNTGSQTFTFQVCDRYYHPLAAGTNITVSAQVPPPANPNESVNQVHVGFGINGTVTLNDVINRGQNITDFSFTLSDGTTEIDQATAVTLTISVSGPNGNALLFINGTVH